MASFKMAELTNEAAVKNDYKCANQIKVIETSGRAHQTTLRQFIYGSYSPTSGNGSPYKNRRYCVMGGCETNSSMLSYAVFDDMDRQAKDWVYDFCKVEDIEIALDVDYSSWVSGSMSLKGNTWLVNQMDELYIGPFLDKSVDDIGASSICDKINFDEPGIPSTRNEYTKLPELYETITMSWGDFESRINRKTNTIRQNKWKKIDDLINELGKYSYSLGLKTGSGGSTSANQWTVKIGAIMRMHIGLYKNDPDEME